MDVKFEPAKFEPEILSFWKKRKIYEKQKKMYASSKKRWSFIDGPITANNPMGAHHAWGRTLKDLYLRWHATRGFEIRRQNGFDAQGLWIEREVEKELGFKRGKKDIEEFGIENFVKKCKERVEKMSARQTEQSIRLGQWMDWDDSYFTHTDKANEYKWYFIKFCHEKGWLFKGKDVIPWCPRCSTAESKHAINTEGYFEVEHDSLYLQFPVVGRKEEYFLVWTTTPWTIPADTAIAVNPSLSYVRVKQDGKHFWLAESRLQILQGKYEIEERRQGAELAGLKYEMPYANLEAQKSANVHHKVVAWDLASGEDGTGIVHMAPGCGPEDYAHSKKENLPALSPLDEEGTFAEGYGKFSGKNVSVVNPEVIEDLQNTGFIYKTEKIKHRYPHCTRCGTPLVFRLVDEWYISMDGLREKAIEQNKTIKWVPEQGQKYEEDWLHNMGDWLISRKRYYGLPLPIWECNNGHHEVIGSVAELRKKAVEGFSKMKELHRPWVDYVKIKCTKCGEKMSRVPDIGDVWMDAGMVPFYTLDWLADKKYFEKWYPADFVTECGPGQYRCWFFFMLLHGVALTGKAPFKSILTNELMKAEDGREMHKSWGNAIWFDEAADKVGADVMRWKYCIQDPAKELWFGWNVLEEQRRNLNVLWNLANYLKIYFGRNFKPRQAKPISVADRWILSKLESLKKNVDVHLAALQPNLAALALQEFFVNTFSREYVHFVRSVLSDESKEQESVLQIMYEVMLDVLVLLSPFIPFTTEKIYQEVFRNFRKEESIHLLEWPEFDAAGVDAALEDEMSRVKAATSYVMAARDKLQRGVKWPIKKVFVVSADEKFSGAIKKHVELIKSLTNVVDISVQAEEPKGISRTVKADYQKIEAKFGKNSPEVIAKIVQMSPESILTKIEKAGKYQFTLSNGEPAELIREELNIQRAMPENLVLAEIEGVSIYLDRTESDNMLASGYSREFIRAVQALRKKAGLQKPDKIALAVSASGRVQTYLKENLDEIQGKVGAKGVLFVPTSEVKKKKFLDKLEVRDEVIEFGF